MSHYMFSSMKPNAKHNIKVVGYEVWLYLYSPCEVYDALNRNRLIKKWHDFIMKDYLPPSGKNILLLYPCTKVKPYNVSPTYKVLFKTLSELNNGTVRDRIHVVVVSEPMALVPMDLVSEFNMWYECPGLFKWWCSKRGIKFCIKCYWKAIIKLSNVIAKYLWRTQDIYKVRIAFLRTCSSSLKTTVNNTHYIMVTHASRKSHVPVKTYPTISQVRRLIEHYGKFAWDIKGISHPYSQQILKNILERLSG